MFEVLQKVKIQERFFKKQIVYFVGYQIEFCFSKLNALRYLVWSRDSRKMGEGETWGSLPRPLHKMIKNCAMNLKKNLVKRLQIFRSHKVRFIKSTCFLRPSNKKVVFFPFLTMSQSAALNFSKNSLFTPIFFYGFKGNLHKSTL